MKRVVRNVESTHDSLSVRIMVRMLLLMANVADFPIRLLTPPWEHLVDLF